MMTEVLELSAVKDLESLPCPAERLTIHLQDSGDQWGIQPGGMAFGMNQWAP